MKIRPKEITDIVAEKLARSPGDITVCFEETSHQNYSQGGVLNPPMEERVMRVNIEWFDNKDPQKADEIVGQITQKLHEVTGAPMEKIETGILRLTGSRELGMPYYIGGKMIAIKPSHTQILEARKLVSGSIAMNS